MVGFFVFHRVMSGVVTGLVWGQEYAGSIPVYPTIHQCSSMVEYRSPKPQIQVRVLSLMQ